MKRIARLLLAAAVLLPLAGGRGSADTITPPHNDPMPDLEVLANVGPWPTLSALIGYRGRVWFANSVRYPDHNSADLYSIGLAAGELRYERHLFTQDVGTPVVAGGLLHWPYEDPRPSVGWGHIAVTDGERWQLRVMPGALPAFHVHAMESLGERLYAATSAWRAGLQVSTDVGLRWRQIYDHPTPKGRVSRIVALAGLGRRLFGALVERREAGPRFPLLMLDGETVSEIPDWPKMGRTLDMAAAKGGIYGLVREAGGVAFWHTDGQVSERLAGADRMPPLRAFTADAGGFWGVGGSSAGGGLWRSGDGRDWHRVQDLLGGRPVDIITYQGQVYVGGAGSDGRGILWGPPASSSLNIPLASSPTWPVSSAPAAVDWTAARQLMADAISEFGIQRGRLRDLAYKLARTEPPLGFFEAALDMPFPDKTMSLFGGRLTPRAVNVGRHVLLWGMGVAGRGKVPVGLLERPWVHAPNRPQKWFDPLPMALFAVSWTGQDDGATVASLIDRLDRRSDPDWLRGDIIGALSAATGKRFGYDINAWRQWWGSAKRQWPR